MAESKGGFRSMALRPRYEPVFFCRPLGRFDELGAPARHEEEDWRR